MSATATRWWSESKRTWIVIEEMHDSHFLNAKRKFERGEYLVPLDPDHLEEGFREPAPGERNFLHTVFEAEVKRRGLDKPREET